MNSQPQKTAPIPYLSPLANAIRAVYHARAALGGTLATLPGLVFAGPTGEQIAAGNVAVARPDAAQTVITQGTQDAIVNWQSFSVGSQEYVQFVQPGSNAAILNRVVGGQESAILGRMSANGRVFLVNPRGVYFGPGAQVDAGGFAASVLDIDDNDFMAHRYVFSRSGNSTGSVVNEGEIKAGQFAALLGDRVDNEGLIEARLGTVVLAAGSAMSMQLDADGLVNFAVDEKTVADLAGVENTGQIIADGGRVLMSAKVADGLVATAVNNEGLVRARGIEEGKGGIFLVGAGGDVVNRGRLDVSGEGNQAGGDVVVRSNQDITLADGSRVTASGGGSGAGGSVRFKADGTLAVRDGASVTASGANAQGGFIELSAHHGMIIDGDVLPGDGGELLIDPSIIRFVDSGLSSGPSYADASDGDISVNRGFIEFVLNNNTDLTIVASSLITATTPMTITATGTGDLELLIGTVLSGTGGCLSFGLCSSGGTFTAGATGNINLSGVNINIARNFDARAGFSNGNVTLGNINAHFVDIAAGVNNIGNVTLGNVSASSVDITAGINGGNITVGGLNISGSTEASLDIFAGNGNVLVNGNIVGAGSSVNFFVEGNSIHLMDVTGTGQTSSGDVFMSFQTHGGNFTARNINFATQQNGSLDLSFDGTGGNFTVNDISLQGGNEADINITNFGGPVTINSIFASAGESTDGGGAFTDVTVRGTNVSINGPVNLFAAGSSGEASFDAVGDFVRLNGPVRLQATGPGGTADFQVDADFGFSVNQVIVQADGRADASFVLNQGGSGIFNGPVQVISSSDPRFAQLSIFTDSGASGPVAFRTTDTGILMAPDISIYCGSEGGCINQTFDVNVRTHAESIFISNYNALPGTSTLAIDNSSFTAPTSLHFFTSSNSVFNSIKVKTGGETGVFSSSDPIAANSMDWQTMNGGLFFGADLIVGGGVVGSGLGDAVAIEVLRAAGIPAPLFQGLPTYIANGAFWGDHYVEFGGELLLNDPDTPYLIFGGRGDFHFASPVVNMNPSGTGEIVAQFTTSPDRDLVLAPVRAAYEDAGVVLFGPDALATYVFVDTNLDQIHGTSFIFGNGPLPTNPLTPPHTGRRVIDPGTNIGDANFICIGGGACEGIENVITTGQIFEVDLFASGVFETVTVKDDVECVGPECPQSKSEVEEVEEETDELLETTDSDDEEKGKVCE